jgi:hypothetical protein
MGLPQVSFIHHRPIRRWEASFGERPPRLERFRGAESALFPQVVIGQRLTGIIRAACTFGNRCKPPVL